MTTTIYSVPGISCGHCKAAIEGEVGKLADVELVTVDVETKQVTVVGDVDEPTIRSAIDEAGYEVTGTVSP